MSTIGHCTPNPNQLTIFVLFGQWLDFVEVRICIHPQILNKAWSIQGGTFFANYRE